MASYAMSPLHVRASHPPVNLPCDRTTVGAAQHLPGFGGGSAPPRALGVLAGAAVAAATRRKRSAGPVVMRCKDHEIDLDDSGKLRSLYKKDSNELLSPQQVASCVQFYHVTQGPEDPDGLPTVTVTPYGYPLSGLKVNLVAGPTGSGKTSLIHILAGGMETQSQLSSDTKCPSVYLVQEDGETIAILDTAGLCDTEAAANDDVGMQELLINSVAATIKRYDLEVVSFFMCVDVAGRLPGNFCEVWPKMQMGLGSEKLDKLCRFVITKANGESRTDKARLKQLERGAMFQELANGRLQWPVCHAGRGNLEGLKQALVPITTDVSGVSSSQVDSSTESLTTKKRAAMRIQQQMQETQKLLAQSDVSVKKLEMRVSGLKATITDTKKSMDKLGWCSGAEREELEAFIDEKDEELDKLSDILSDGKVSKKDLDEALQEFRRSLNKTMAVIKSMEIIGKFFKKLATSEDDDNNNDDGTRN